MALVDKNQHIMEFMEFKTKAVSFNAPRKPSIGMIHYHTGAWRMERCIRFVSKDG